jgi:ribosomal protein S6--L-glutamate ligase
LVEVAKERGHQVQVINTLRCYMSIDSKQLGLHYSGNAIENLSAVIPRIGASITFYGTAVARQLEMMGVYLVNSSNGITCSRDKLHCFQALSLNNVPLPHTGFAYTPDDIQDLIKMVGGAPFVLKLLEGTQGKGVVLAETPNAASSVIDAFSQLKANILIQQYMADAKGCDIRCFVIGNTVVASMQRQAKPGEFRSNLHRGGVATPIEITEEEKTIAVKAAQIIGLNIAGVDMLRTKDGPMVLEVNSSPGLKGIEKATNINVAEKIITFIENATVIASAKRAAIQAES